MDLTRAIDSYCERTGPEYWSEPVNAVTNLAFLVAALVMWGRIGRADLPLARALMVLLGVIGIGSYLFHTHGQAWSAIADTVPILGFVLLYIYTANRGYWRMSRRAALGATILFFPFAAATLPVFRLIPGIGSSAGYAPVPALILIYAALLRRRLPAVARGLAIGAAVLVVSLICRSVDEIVCPGFPLGTHFLWHILNAVMLGWMIEVYRRHEDG